MPEADSHKLGLGLVAEARHFQRLLHDCRVVGVRDVCAGGHTHLTSGEQAVCDRQANTVVSQYGLMQP